VPNVVRLLVERGADVNAQDEEGRIALIHATEGGNTEVVQILLDKGADRSVKDRNGHTALMIAEVRDRVQIAELLKNTNSKP